MEPCRLNYCLIHISWSRLDFLRAMAIPIVLTCMATHWAISYLVMPLYITRGCGGAFMWCRISLWLFTSILAKSLTTNTLVKPLIANSLVKLLIANTLVKLCISDTLTKNLIANSLVKPFITSTLVKMWSDHPLSLTINNIVILHVINQGVCDACQHHYTIAKSQSFYVIYLVVTPT